MTLFLTFSVYSLRIASDIPVQSDFLPKISIYFILSIIYAQLAMIWFILCNRFTTQGKLPMYLDMFGDKLKLIYFCCFTKENEKINKTTQIDDSQTNKGLSVANGEQNMNTIKHKCNSCDRCNTCDEEHSKTKSKEITKKDVEAKLQAINYLTFSIFLVSIFISQLVVWLTMPIQIEIQEE